MPRMRILSTAEQEQFEMPPVFDSHQRKRFFTFPKSLVETAQTFRKAFGQIVKSLFILHYLDELELRQAIEKQLNKVELANRFTRAVAVGNPREFTQAEKEKQEIAESCNRLIKNCIICWNYLYLSQKRSQAETQETKDCLLEAITTHSVISWAHINLLGEYDFSDEKLQDSVGILLPKLVA